MEPERLNAKSEGGISDLAKEEHLLDLSGFDNNSAGDSHPPPGLNLQAGPIQLFAHESILQNKGGLQGNSREKDAPLQLTQKVRDEYPWNGEIIGTWSAALRQKPEKDDANPHEGTMEDLPHQHDVKVLGKTNGWLKVETVFEGKTLVGYVSQELVGLVHDISESRSQDMKDVPQTSPGYEKKYSWDANFRLVFDYKKKYLKVRVKLYASVSDQQKATWKGTIDQYWNGRRHLEVTRKEGEKTVKDKYKILMDVEWTDKASQADHMVNFLSGRTTNMGNWGDDNLVGHEFGHMLGNKDEYFTIDGVKHGDAYQKGKGIMNNPDELPFTEHYDLIKQQSASALDVDVSVCKIL